MCKNSLQLTCALVGLLASAANQNVLGHPCPEGASDTAVGMALAAFRVRSDGTVETAPIAGGSVGPCQKIRLRMSISYTTPGASGGTAAAFSGGRMVVHTQSGSFSQDVTPASGVPTIAPLADTAPGGCAAGGATFFASDLTPEFEVSTHLAEIVNGRITFIAEYGPEGTVAHFVGGDIFDLVHGFIPITVRVDTLPSCSIDTQSLTVCSGNSASFTASATGGKGPYSFSWTGPNGFTQTDNNVTNSTITINNAQAANAGTYTATVTDANTCTNTCNATLAVIPTPSCQITGDSPVCGRTTHTYTSTVSPSGGTVIHNWSISGDGTINGAKDGPSVSVTAGASGSFTLTDNVTRNGCPGQCTMTVPVNPIPTCSISGDSPVCGGTTHSYTSTVLPVGGTVTHDWSISGDGTITGPKDGPSVSVTAGASGSFTLTDNITRDGCPGQCTLSVPINPNPTCNISGDTVVCSGTMHSYASTVLPVDGTVTHNWSITGNGTINGAKDGPSVSVTAGASGSFTLTDNVTRDGCPGECNLRVSVNPIPTCSISGDSPVCGGTTHSYTSTVLPTGGTVTHDWSISGSGTINGAKDGPSVSVTAGASGSFTLTDNITRNGCPGQCTVTVPINPSPTCNIGGDTVVCGRTTHTYTSTMLPTGGTVTHNWSIDGNGTINGAKDGPSVSVTAGASGSFTLTDNVIRDGCPGECTLRVSVNPIPTCNIGGDSPVCGGTTHTYTSTVLPTGATVTHNWAIDGNGTINGAKDGPSVSVTAGASGSFTLTDNITRDGCPGECTLRVSVNPIPTCNISADSPVCGGTTHTYTSSLLPAGGSVTHNWSITGDGTIIGPKDGPSVSVTAGASGSFTLTDNVTRDGCSGQCTLSVPINPRPTCNINGDTVVCGGTTHTYASTVLPVDGTVTHNWSITGDGAITGPKDGSSVSVTAGGSGSFTLTDNITRNGCPSECTLRVTVNPNPTCTISGASPVCGGTTHTYTSTVLPAGGSVTHNWSISGDGTITGPKDGPSVSVIAGTSGSFTLTDDITREGCPGQCLLRVPVNPNPTCTISGDSPVCGGTTHSYTSTVSPAAGTVTHNWSISGDGTITGPKDGPSVSVTAGASGSFTLTDNITREGCPGQCTLTVAVNPSPTCNITGDSPVCGGTTHTYTSAVSPAIGTVTHNWSISGDGTISGAKDGSSVSVTAGATGSFTLTDNITRDGCPGQCTLSVPINPNPTCIVSGDSPVCGGTTHTYASTVSPASGTVTHNWSISGNGTMNGSTTGASVSVTAGPLANGNSFTLTDNITRNGCAGQCVLQVPIIACDQQIAVFKQVVCVGEDGTCMPFNNIDLTDQGSASGVKGETCMAFCYRITVMNTSPDSPLLDLTVRDTDLDLSGCSFPKSLAPGATVSCVIPNVQRCSSSVSTVTARAKGGPGGTQSVSAQDSATVTVLPISLKCDVVLHSTFDMDAQAEAGRPDDNHVTLSDSGPVDFSLTVNNTGQADLSVVISGLPCSVDLDDNPIPTTFTLPVGASSNFVCSVEVTCTQGTNITVRVTGTAIVSDGSLCVSGANGNPITTTLSRCSASVTCGEPVTCRVTGGGTLIDGTVDNSCIDVPTTILPFVVNGLTVNKITHGGQLGAPFSQMDCGAILGNPCIRGQWQHTRHYHGKGNPRDVIDMDFHSVTPKGQFDSLSCACLGCCDPASGVFLTPTFGPLIHKFALCNPDDHKVCGPQPRPSPANAIIFSGVGRLIPTDDIQGGRLENAEWVIFRVYIEDRSEPGGFHPKGAIEPADIYCFQAWKTGIKVSKKPDFSTVSPDFRTALGAANCEFLAALESGALPIGSLPSPTVNGATAEIQDCGPLHDGNHQIHPSTSATCTQ